MLIIKADEGESQKLVEKTYNIVTMETDTWMVQRQVGHEPVPKTENSSFCQ